MKQINKVMIPLLFISLLGLFDHQVVLADDSSQDKMEDIHNKQDEVEKSMDAKKEKLTKLEQNKAEMKDALKQITAKVDQTNEKVAELNEKIEQTKKEMTALKADIKKTKQKIKERMGVLKKRARALQVNDTDRSYLSVLMGSQDFGDFIERATAVSTIAKADQNLLEEQKKNQQHLEKDQKELKEKEQQEKNALEELESVKVQLQYQMDEKNSLIEKMKQESMLTTKELDQLKQESNQLSSQEQKLIEEEKRKEELAEKKREEERARREREKQQAQAEAQSKSEKSNKTVSSNSGATTHKEPKPQQLTGTVHKGSGAIEAAIQAGSSLVGSSPYNWGGGRNSTDIANRSFDCSSFVRWAYSQAGVNLGSVTGTSTNTLVNRGRRVSASSMQRGDIVFFDTYKTNGHVGIYLGNGRFLDDNSSSGVSIDSMNNSYWRAAFNGVVRRVVE
ncbi:NlpC/P60 family protein [Halobacillus rhizosphaerae]|uniref:C40 family peptidase n=1 Tax=Halobacillus rhizosphaerae TaxID=3064889 RepID=UPI00398B922A